MFITRLQRNKITRDLYEIFNERLTNARPNHPHSMLRKSKTNTTLGDEALSSQTWSGIRYFSGLLVHNAR